MLTHTSIVRAIHWKFPVCFSEVFSVSWCSQSCSTQNTPLISTRISSPVSSVVSDCSLPCFSENQLTSVFNILSCSDVCPLRPFSVRSVRISDWRTLTARRGCWEKQSWRPFRIGCRCACCHSIRFVLRSICKWGLRRERASLELSLCWSIYFEYIVKHRVKETRGLGRFGLFWPSCVGLNVLFTFTF